MTGKEVIAKEWALIARSEEGMTVNSALLE